MDTTLTDTLSVFITGTAAFFGLVSGLCPRRRRQPLAEDFYSTVTVQEFHAREQVQKWWRP